MSRIVGIDLGTTNSEVAYIRDRHPVVVTAGGGPVLPSVVGLSAEGRLLVGREARNQYIAAPERTIRSIKRKMGTEERVALGERVLSPPEVSALILGRLRAMAEEELGEPIDRALITVPAYFTDVQRQATRDAGEIAGLRVERILNEPTAAALAYRSRRTDRETLLVYDLGGGTFDVSCVQAEAEIAEVLASHGDTRLGGDDFDRLIVDLMADRFRTEHGVDLRQELRSLSALTHAAERAKIELSSQPYARMQVEFIAEHAGKPLHLDTELSRAELEALLRPRLEATLISVRQALRDARIPAEALDTVLLVGGSTRIPLVAELLAEELGRPPRAEVDPELVVALGAATQAAIIAGEDVEAILVDVTPHSLGIATLEWEGPFPVVDRFSVILPRNTVLPVSRTEPYRTAVPGQEAVEIRVFQGESRDVKDNQLLGEFRLDDLSESEDEPIPLLVRFDLNLDGMLHVSAIEKETGRQAEVTIAASRSRLSAAEKQTAREQVAELMAGAGQEGTEADTEKVAALRQLVRQAREAPRPEDEQLAEALREAADRLEALLAAGTRDWPAIEQAEEELTDALYELE
jgi:molecular chaperone DnaK